MQSQKAKIMEWITNNPLDAHFAVERFDLNRVVTKVLENGIQIVNYETKSGEIILDGLHEGANA